MKKVTKFIFCLGFSPFDGFTPGSLDSHYEGWSYKKKKKKRMEMIKESCLETFQRKKGNT